MYNQGNYQQFGQRLPAVPPPPPSSLQQGPHAYLIPQHSNLNAPQNSDWNQNQHVSPSIPPPRIPPPNQQGQHFYRVPPHPLLPGGLLPLQPTSSYFTPAPFGPLGHLPPPPPPPPSSPPPGLPPLPPSPPLESLSTDAELSASSRKPSVADMNGDSLNFIAVNDSDTGVKDTSDISPPKPKDEKTVRKIEVLCQYIAKNGNEFEDMTCQKEIDNPEFKFLFGGPPGSEAAISHEYYKWMKKKCSSSALLDGSHTRDVSHSPAGSDMDMEDDITQLDHQEPDFISNKVDIKLEEHACDSQYISQKDSTDGNTFVSESSGVNQSDTSRVPGELTEGSNPIRLIQGYASDNTSENDNGLHFENVSPVAVSPHIKEDTSVLHAFQTDTESKNPSDPKSRPLSVPTVEHSLNTSSKVPEPSTTTEDLKNKKDSYLMRYQGKQDDRNAKSEVDEFGRLVKAGGISDNDSVDYRRRRAKRGRSRSRSRSRSRCRSRSRSPNGRRRRTPRRRRREKRSQSRSPSPYRKREETGADWTRRNKSELQVCYDFRRGKCHRGPTCLYFHESEKNDEFRRHKSKHHYNHEVSDRSSEKVKEEFVDPSSQYEEVNSIDPPEQSEQPVTESVTPPQLPNQIAPPVTVPSSYPLLSAPPSSVWNPLPLPPPPPRPQISGPLLQYLQNQPTLQLNYPFQPFFRPELPLQQPYFGQSRILTHYNPYASTFDQPLTTSLTTGFSQETGSSYKYGQSQYDPLFDSIEPPSNLNVVGNTKQKDADVAAASVENDEFGETGDAEVGAVENDSPSSPIDLLPDVATGEVEIDQVKDSGKVKKNKDSRSMKLFKVSLAEFVKEVLKPSWRQGNMSKEAFKTIVKKTVDKVSGAIKKHQIPKSQAKINQYIDSSQRKLTKLVMGYVDKYVKV